MMKPLLLTTTLLTLLSCVDNGQTGNPNLPTLEESMQQLRKETDLFEDPTNIPSSQDVTDHLNGILGGPVPPCPGIEDEDDELPPGPTPSPAGQAPVSESKTQLTAKRKVDPRFKECLGLGEETSFAEVVQLMVEKQMKPAQAMRKEAGLFDAFGIPEGSRSKVGLASHQMCGPTPDLLRAERNNPDQETQNWISDYSNDYNKLQAAYAVEQNPERKNKIHEKIVHFWTEMMGNLAYSESLGDPDTGTSKRMATRTASEAGIENFEKPPGVKFYYDALQKDVASRINIGLFQFSPDARGNIRTCLMNWNRDFPSCPISVPARGQVSEMVKILGTSEQAFNAYCGVNKILQTFDVQANTTKSRSTSNKNGQKSGGDRCVSLHVAAGKGYNHFGPLQNTLPNESGGGNMKKWLRRYQQTKAADSTFAQLPEE